LARRDSGLEGAPGPAREKDGREKGREKDGTYSAPTYSAPWKSGGEGGGERLRDGTRGGELAHSEGAGEGRGGYLNEDLEERVAPTLWRPEAARGRLGRPVGRRLLKKEGCRTISARARERRDVLALSNRKVVVGGRRRRKSDGEGGGERLRGGVRGGELAVLRRGAEGEGERLPGRSLRKGWHRALLPYSRVV
jgi:hypothetical protein